MSVTAKQAIATMEGWIGLDRAKGTHKPIVDTYNKYIKAHPGTGRGYLVTYSDAYCATTVSAAFITLNAVDAVGGVECGVEEYIKIFQKAGIWNEDGKSTPAAGDIICYNWDDSTQPNDGYADHIGIVASVDAKNKTFRVIEGNINGKVGARLVPFGWGPIRGFARPKYAAAKVETPAKTETAGAKQDAGSGVGKCSVELPTFVAGAKHNGVKAIQVLLKRQGYLGKDGKKLKVDGKLGENTAHALTAFQKAAGMTGINYGTVAQKTWAALIAAAK